MNYFDTKKLAGYIGGEVSSDVMDEEPKTTRELKTTLAEHKKTCEARPGNCPFEKDLQTKIEESKEGEQGDADTGKASEKMSEEESYRELANKRKERDPLNYNFGGVDYDKDGGLVWDEVCSYVQNNIRDLMESSVDSDFAKFEFDNYLFDRGGVAKYTVPAIESNEEYESGYGRTGSYKIELEAADRSEDVEKDVAKYNATLADIGLELIRDDGDAEFWRDEYTGEFNANMKDGLQISVKDPEKYQAYLNRPEFVEYAKDRKEYWGDD